MNPNGEHIHELQASLAHLVIKVKHLEAAAGARNREIDELRRKLAEAESENVRLRAMLLAEEMVEL